MRGSKKSKGSERNAAEMLEIKKILKLIRDKRAFNSQSREEVNFEEQNLFNALFIFRKTKSRIIEYHSYTDLSEDHKLEFLTEFCFPNPSVEPNELAYKYLKKKVYSDNNRYYITLRDHHSVFLLSSYPSPYYGYFVSLDFPVGITPTCSPEKARQCYTLKSVEKIKFNRLNFLAISRAPYHEFMFDILYTLAAIEVFLLNHYNYKRRIYFNALDNVSSKLVKDPFLVHLDKSLDPKKKVPETLKLKKNILRIVEQIEIGNTSKKMYEINPQSMPVFRRIKFGVQDWESSHTTFRMTYGLRTLVSLINPTNILEITKRMLLERTVVFISRDTKLVTATMFAFLELIKPFKLQLVFIPILPERLSTFIESPVPVFVGMKTTMDTLKKHLKKRINHPNTLLVDIDKGDIKEINCTSDDILPDFPDYHYRLSQLRLHLENAQRVINSIYGEYVQNSTYGYKVSTKEEREAMLSILDFARESNLGLVSGYEKCFVSDISTKNGVSSVFLQEDFLASKGKKEKRFLEAFVQTQCFQRFIEVRSSEFEEEIRDRLK